MSDKFEDFMKQNRGAADVRTPNDRVWQRLNSKLAEKPMPRPAGKILLAGVTVVTAMLITAFVWFGGEKAAPGPAGSDASFTMVKTDGYQKFVQPPLSGVDVPYQKFNVSATAGGSVTLSSGTQIEVPQEAFVDAKGEPVKGDIQLAAREFHDVAAVMASGIPMKFDDNGVMRDFQTAGMIDLRGTANGEEIFIAKDKALAVSMASFAPENDYNLYFLDPVSQQWKEIGQPENAVNEEKQKAIAALGPAPELPQAPEQAPSDVPLEKEKPDDLINDPGSLDNRLQNKTFVNEFAFSVDYKIYPELKAFDNIKWKAVDEENLKANEWIFNEVWNDVKITGSNAEEGTYTLLMTSRKKTFTMIVAPLLSGRDFEKEMARYNKLMEKYAKDREKREAEMARLDQQRDVTRTFYASNFGVFNCDRFYAALEPVRFAATFRVEGEEMPENAMVFHCTGDSRALMTYTGVKVPVFTCSPKEENWIFIVLGGNRLAMLTASDFNRMLNRNSGVDNLTITCRVVQKTISTPDDLRALMIEPSSRIENDVTL